LDPSGGAGISADIEALAANGCHCAPIITALTEQDTHNVKNFFAINEQLIIRQAQTVMADMTISAIKIGMVGSIENIKALTIFLKTHPHIPVILDPVLAAGGGTALATQEIAQAIVDLLLPYTTIVTPNIQEACALSHTDTSTQDCAKNILKSGCQTVLITGTHAPTTNIIHSLFTNNADVIQFEGERLPHDYHGSGCTLAASLAGFIAHGFSMQTAIEKALAYTFGTLKSAHCLSSGQRIPNRFFKVGM
jgi:hydroxymethylpyrimidine/phosphomethylpyrimidine kinase